MTARDPSPREILETLGQELSLDSLRAKFPKLSDGILRDIFLKASTFFHSEHAASQPKAVDSEPPKDKWIANIDGGSRGNPGPAASGAWVRTPKGIVELKRFIGDDTNNAAEYEALLLVLETARDRAVEKIEIRSDSELLVKQMTGAYRVKNRNLMARFIRAKNLEKMFKSFKIIHVPREENTEADRLVNEALDEVSGKCNKRKRD